MAVEGILLLFLDSFHGLVKWGSLVFFFFYILIG